ncbi:MAG: hypothetical protein BGO69_17275 [Bacteroidetes bacterium 46-16]|nr:MAG: hypothetical protein BGO69_17275 [Bacteroidetes bacterium 46-16]
MKKKSTFYLAVIVISILLPSLRAAAMPTMQFIPNNGQWLEPSLYRVNLKDLDIFMERNAVTYVLADPMNAEYVHGAIHGDIPADKPVFRYHAYKMILEGASMNPGTKGNNPQEMYYNYFHGNDPAHWKSNIHPFTSVDYTNVYPGIGMHFHSQDNHFTYDFMVAPGADASQIKLRFAGTDGVSIKNGNLILKTSLLDVAESAPYAYQEIGGLKIEVPCHYALKDNVISYVFPSGYDHKWPLIIDPSILFATYTGSTSSNLGFSATYDNQGYSYVAGWAGGIGYPLTVGAFQSTYGGGSQDVGITKFNLDGTAIVWSTLLGGNGSDLPHSTMVDAVGNLVITGVTESTNFPVSASAYDQTSNGNKDLFVTKLNPTGTALIGSTYVGGSGQDGGNDAPLNHSFGDTYKGEVTVDDNGNVYVAGNSHSSNFPVTANAFQATNGGSEDGVVFKLNSDLSALLWSSYIGGSGKDAVYNIDLDIDQSHFFISGGTESSNFPVTAAAYQSTYQGGTLDGFVARIENSGNYLLEKSTYIGTSSYDQCYGLEIDPSNGVYICGQSDGGTFPVIGNVYSNAGSGNFIMKLDYDLTAPVFSTVIGNGTHTSSALLSQTAFLVDSCYHIYLTGFNLSLPTNFPIAANPMQNNNVGFYFIVLGQDAATFEYATYYGSQSNHTDGGTSRFDKRGIIYQGICCCTNNFPTTPNVWSPNSGDGCNMVMLKMTFDTGPVDAAALAVPMQGCAPLTVNFLNNSANATSYVWDFGDNTPISTLTAPTHIYTTPGTYTVMLAAENPNSCRVHDTDYLTIIVVDSGGPDLVSAFTAQILDSCSPYPAQFTNTSQGTTANTQFLWDFGDNTSYNGANPPVHNYPSPGIYSVKLVLIDSTSCNGKDSVTQSINFPAQVVVSAVAAVVDSSGCNPFTAQFQNNSVNATSYLWDFGDNTTSTATAPSHTYTSPGTYTVKLIGYNQSGCLYTDTAVLTVISVTDSSFQSDFTLSVTDSCNPYIAQFTNASIGTTPFTQYLWRFGDNTTYTGPNPPAHNYASTGTYNVTLVITDTTLTCSAGIDSIIHPVTFSTFDVDAAASVSGDTAGCSPFLVQFQNNSQNATSYTWDFGDNTPASTLVSPAHTYYLKGLDTVRLIAESNSPSACKSKDTAYLYIRVDSADLAANFTFQVTDSCNPYKVSFTNTTPYTTAQSHFSWDFGDNTTFTGATPPVHSYPATGTYQVRLIVTDTTTCNKADTIIKPVTFTTFDVAASAAVTADTEGCAPFLVQFQNNSQNATSYIWDFGDNSPQSTLANPSHSYTIFGVHTVRLIAESTSPSACKKKDTTYLQIKVDTANINANISYTIMDSCDPYTVQFGNSSSVITPWAQFTWDFGDNTTFTGITPPLHYFPAAGTYQVTLTAVDTATCNGVDTISKIISFSTFSVTASASIQPDTPGCSPVTIQFSNNSQNATSYLWDFGDNTPMSNNASPSHTYITKGTHHVMLVATNPSPSACRHSDTAWLVVKVDSGLVASDFDPVIIDSCDPYQVSFVNHSQAVGNTTQYAWDFGDNTGSGFHTPPMHTYPDSGTYSITLVVKDNTSCNKIDSITKTVWLHGYRVKADFSHPDVCGEGLMPFYNFSTNGKNWLWDFGDGTTDSNKLVSHLYSSSGDYNVVLVVSDPQSCNGTDTAAQSVHVKFNAHAAFDFAPVPPQKNQPIVFANLSTHADRYVWSYGDGMTSNEKNPSRLYDWTGTFNVCLVANNADNCPDTVCRDVGADIDPIADVPTAFSPNGDGINDILYVRGPGIDKVELKIYNRWGQLIFETHDKNVGWDGTYKGEPQPTESYAYVLNVSLRDGQVIQKVGNINLLR